MFKNLFITCTLLAMTASAKDIYVSPQGKDSNDGSVEAPYATIERAQQLARQTAGDEITTIYLREGIFYLDKTLKFTLDDSGSADFPVIYKGFESEAVTISGAKALQLNWQEYKDGTYQAKISSSEAIDQLFINNKRQDLARYPNNGDGYLGKKKAKGGHAPYEGCAPDAWTTRAKKWANPQGAFLHGMHSGLWGSVHYKVLGKNTDGSLKTEGGWQNNRVNRGVHQEYRMVENVFEELDTPGEWFHDLAAGILYFKPTEGLDLSKVKVEAVFQLAHLIEIYGDSEKASMTISDGGNGIESLTIETPKTTEAVKYISFEGITFTGTARTFMDTKEPLLRSDWSIYRGGAIHARGTENITIEKCSFKQLGGNAVFVDGYNRNFSVKSSIFSHNGASDINFVGSPAAVRAPAFSYNSPQADFTEIDTTIGPKTDEYPADCLVEDNLMDHAGRFEKQVAGVNINMSSRITLSHNTIHHTPRAAINIGDGTWGGHLIEFNDCFETVLETHDHGALNGWGRDRFWHQASPSGPRGRDKNGQPVMLEMLKLHPTIYNWDAYQTTTINNNRMHCDHGWDIDLDDGCTNYIITNNLCLSGGLKNREGSKRTVRNNIITGRGFTCNVPYPKPVYDTFDTNILWGGTYSVSDPALWGGVRNNNLFHNPAFKKAVAATGVQAMTNDDEKSLVGDAMFTDPANLDFTVKESSVALQMGFKNFPMDQFGVTSPELKKLAPKPTFIAPRKAYDNKISKKKVITLYGAVIDQLDTEAELTATGMFDKTGVIIVTLPPESQLKLMGFEIDDVVVTLNGKKVNRISALSKPLERANSGEVLNVTVMRNQSMHEFEITVQ